MQELYPYLIPGIAFSAGAGLAIAEHIYWERIYLRRAKKRAEKEMYRESKRNERVVNDLVKALNDINLDELKRRSKIFR